jgi:phosphoadenosine phosphosulfate reductase
MSEHAAFIDAIRDVRDPVKVLSLVAREFADRAVLASSFGVEDQVLIDMIARNDLDIGVFTLDTGRLYQETYALIERTRARYGINVDMYLPDATDVEEMVSTEGPELFRRSVELRKHCCDVRKSRPLARALAERDAWVCGLRRDQSVTRSALEVAELDDNRVKISPLAHWSEQDVWDYVKEHNVPHNTLHDLGYRSIGCACCTRAVSPGEDIRAGRWWWESPENKECGIHLHNADPESTPLIPHIDNVSK